MTADLDRYINDANLNRKRNIISAIKNLTTQIDTPQNPHEVALMVEMIILESNYLKDLAVSENQ